MFSQGVDSRAFSQATEYRLAITAHWSLWTAVAANTPSLAKYILLNVD